MAEPLLIPRPEGLYCPSGNFYIDPSRPVARALITHGHADHARAGHGHVLATRQTLEIMAIRYGEDFAGQRQAYEGPLSVGGVDVSFHPAGHVLGSAQIAITHKGQRIVASGDYARVANPSCAPFEPVPCDTFITEATFALPVFKHPDPAEEMAKLMASMRAAPERPHLVGAYALGKAQRVIMLAREAGYDAPIYIHGALQRLCDYHLEQGIPLGDLRPATMDKAEARELREALVIAPPSAFSSPWVQRFADPVISFASGWMQIRARARQRGVELPLVISDHIDWVDLTRTVREIDPSELWITHGREEALMRWAELEGRVARPLHLVGYEEEPE
ncbi:DNA ligase-associated DEXH box helicase [Thioclava sp. F42-5]|uniref:ligase-associated DNA damage response exonuclease n=1 Tax=unclassified Thioclava TaxID=2621713 RepID=UPI000B53F356|nr:MULTISPECIES: ligase-associated DNA damage response exonuclease [unclassified Thioclava]OWY09172.1 DNA ligase-associated DEXH box helicase [Thioclava sp. F42-5]PWE50525.1 ligase-associated DNA damage response exonuclease [Thioclava sp. NG1]